MARGSAPEAWFLRRGQAGYPAGLAPLLGEAAPPALAGWGPAEMVGGLPWLGLVCSVRCPGDAILGAYDAAVALREAGVPVAGGFDAPMERECLRFLLRGGQPLLICRPRGPAIARVDPSWRPALAEGRLILLAAHAEAPRRLDRRSAAERNRLLVALSSGLFLPHARPGGHSEALAREALGWGKAVYTLDLPANTHLLSAGVRPLPGDLAGLAAGAHPVGAAGREAAPSP